VIDAHGDLDKLGSKRAGHAFAIYEAEWWNGGGYGFGQVTPLN